jgi:hypothetical protein
MGWDDGWDGLCSRIVHHSSRTCCLRSMAGWSRRMRRARRGHDVSMACTSTLLLDGDGDERGCSGRVKRQTSGGGDEDDDDRMVGREGESVNPVSLRLSAVGLGRLEAR